MGSPLDVVILGLSITSSWGNGHATTFRALVRELARRGHRVLFLERDMPWYRDNRDLPAPPFGRTELYDSVESLRDRFSREVAEADAVIVGSYVPDGVEVGDWVIQTSLGVRAFYDIDTPITLAALERRDCTYLDARQIPRYDLYLSFTGGPTLTHIEQRWGAPRARALYCSVDAEAYRPVEVEPRWDLGYLGTYSHDRQPALERTLLAAACDWPKGRFVVAGPQYPEHIEWPSNVQRIHHLPPAEHARFYCSQRFTLNVTRSDMVRAGYAPSVRLFEAAACGVPILSDEWSGLETILRPDEQILLVREAADVLAHLRDMPEPRRRQIGESARQAILARHTARHRAEELESHLREAMQHRSARQTPEPPGDGRVH